MAKFQEAWRFQDQLDPATRQQLKDKLTFLRSATAEPLPIAGAAPLSPLEQVNSQQEIVRQKLYREILNEEKAAQDLAQRDPRGALSNLQSLRERVNSAEVDPAAKKQLLTIVDRLTSQLAAYIEQNKGTIENDEKNAAVRADIVRDQEMSLEKQNKLAQMVEQFNQLIDEQRFPEAEILARQAKRVRLEAPFQALDTPPEPGQIEDHAHTRTALNHRANGDNTTELTKRSRALTQPVRTLTLVGPGH